MSDADTSCNKYFSVPLAESFSDAVMHYSTKLCTTDTAQFFPFPLSLEPKAWNCKQGEYVIPDDVMKSMFSEFKVSIATTTVF